MVENEADARWLYDTYADTGLVTLKNGIAYYPNSYKWIEARTDRAGKYEIMAFLGSAEPYTYRFATRRRMFNFLRSQIYSYFTLVYHLRGKKTHHSIVLKPDGSWGPYERSS